MQNAGEVVLKNLLAAGLSVLEFPAPFDGTITRIDIMARAANANGDTIFDVNINDATIFADQTQRPKLLQNQVTGAKIGLNVAVTRGQWITVDADIVPPGGFPGKISISVTMEDVFVIGAANGVAGLDAGAKVPIAQLPHGVANGIADLDSGGKVPIAQLPAAVAGALDYQGTWNANTNTPALASGGGGARKGDFYKVSVAGATNLDGLTDWKVGDYAIFDGAAWGKLDQTESVSSVAGKVGAVTLAAADVAGLGTAATKDVAASGDASAAQVVLGNDSRLLSVLAGLVAQSYGSKTAVPVITIDTKGRITVIATVSIAPGGDLGGTDITGAVVNGLKGRSIAGIPSVPGFVSDNFNDNALDSMWATQGSTVHEQNQRLEMSVQVGGIQAWIRLATAYNLTGHRTSVRIVELFYASGLSSAKLLNWYNPTSGNTNLRWEYLGSTNQIQARGGNPNTIGDRSFGTLTLDGSFSYIAIREQSGAIHFETSADGVNWTDRFTHGLDSGETVNAGVNVQAWWEGSGTAHYYFDDFNTDIAQSDSIANSDGFAIVWVNTNNRFELQRVSAIAAGISAAPSGVPANHVAGQCEMRFDRVNHILYVYNENTGHWDYVSLPNFV